MCRLVLVYLPIAPSECCAVEHFLPQCRQLKSIVGGAKNVFQFKIYSNKRRLIILPFWVLRVGAISIRALSATSEACQPWKSFFLLRLFLRAVNTAIAPLPGLACFLASTPPCFSTLLWGCDLRTLRHLFSYLTYSKHDRRGERRGGGREGEDGEGWEGGCVDGHLSEEKRAVTSSARWDMGHPQVNGFMCKWGYS